MSPLIVVQWIGTVAVGVLVFFLLVAVIRFIWHAND